MSSATSLRVLARLTSTSNLTSRNLSLTSTSNERFGTSKGESGWTWDKNGVGMGGKDIGEKNSKEKYLLRVIFACDESRRL